MVGCQPLGHCGHYPNREVWRNTTQNTNCFAYLLIFFRGPPEQVSVFTYVISPLDCEYLWDQQKLLYNLWKWYNQCLTEGLLAKCCLTLKCSGRPSHSLCRTERPFIQVSWLSIWEKVGLLETSGTSSLKTDTAMCLVRYSTQSKMACSLDWRMYVWNYINELLEEQEYPELPQAPERPHGLTVI